MYGYITHVPRSVYTRDCKQVSLFASIYILCKLNPLDQVYISFENVLWNMFGEMPSRRTKDTLRESFHALFTDGVLEGESQGSNAYILNKQQFIYKDHFARINYDDYIAIMKSELKCKYALFRYLCALMGSRGADKLSNMKAGFFADMLEVNVRTIYSYNEELEKMHIIYIKRSAHLESIGEGDVYRENNTYCAYADRYLLLSAKSMGQKLAQLKKGKQYSEAEIKEIYDYVDAHNEREYQKAAENPDYVPSILTK